jgi:pseudouridine kinase
MTGDMYGKYHFSCRFIRRENKYKVVLALLKPSFNASVTETPTTLPGHRPVLCIGAANIDRKLRTLDAVAMGSSNPARQHESFGGVARNIAENLARLGTPVALLTAVGNDSSGQALLAQAQGAGIDMRAILQLDGAGSGTYTAVLNHDGQMVVALADMALYEALTPDFLATRRQQRADAALIVADLNLPIDAVAALQQDALRDGVPLVLVAVSEPKMARLPRDLHGVRLLIVNEGELSTRVGRALHGEAELAAACREVQAQGAQDVIVTRGARGVSYTGAGGVKSLPAPAAQVVDVTGAGDAFSAGVCWSLYGGSGDLALACRRGLHLAGLTLASAQTVCPQLAPDTLAAITNASHQD